MKRALVQAREICQDVIVALAEVNKKRAKVKLDAVKLFVEQSRFFHALLQEAVRDDDGEDHDGEEDKVVEEEKEPVAKQSGRRSKVSEELVPYKKRGQKEALVEAEEPRRNKRVVEEKVEEVEEEGEVEEEVEEEVVLPSPKKKGRTKLKSGDVCKGPKDELVFYMAQQRKSVLECPVYGRQQEEVFDKSDLAPCDFASLTKEEQNWACVQLCHVYAECIKRGTRAMDKNPWEVFAQAHATLQARDKDWVFVNEHADKKGADPNLFALVRDVQQLHASSGICKDSVVYMMVAKLHEELSNVVGHGELVKKFRELVCELCKEYNIGLQPLSLERYLPVGRMILKCRALAFVNVTILLEQQKVTQALLEKEEMMVELSSLLEEPRKKLLSLESGSLLLESGGCGSGGGCGDGGDNLPVAGALASLMRCLCAAAPDDLEVTSVGNAPLSALGFAKLLKMNFGNCGTPCDDVGPFEPFIVWEYMNLVNTSLVEVGRNGWCLVESFRDDRVPENQEWIAVACFDSGAGVLLNFVEKKIVVHSYQGADDEALRETVKVLVARLKFPKKFRFESTVVNGFEDVGLLHWLSHVVWGEKKDVDELPHELVRLQVAYEFLKNRLLPPEVSFLQLITESQESVDFRVQCGKVLDKDSLRKMGFFVVRGFLPNCESDVVAELCQHVKDFGKLQRVFQGSHDNDDRRVQANIETLSKCSQFSEELKGMLDAVVKKMGSVVPNRPVQEMVALLSLKNCGPQRPHADYTRASLSNIEDDGFCDGLPLGVIIALQPKTRFDAWPGAVDWDESRFYEHIQVKLGPGDAVFFLGNAVHAGAGFEEENVRLHSYLENADVQRLPNTTYFMDLAAGVANVLPRGVKLHPKSV